MALPPWGSGFGIVEVEAILVPLTCPCASKGLSTGGLWKEALICQEALFCKPGSIHGKYPRLFKAFGPLFLAQKTWFYIGCIWYVTHEIATLMLSFVLSISDIFTSHCFAPRQLFKRTNSSGITIPCFPLEVSARFRRPCIFRGTNATLLHEGCSWPKQKVGFWKYRHVVLLGFSVLSSLFGIASTPF